MSSNHPSYYNENEYCQVTIIYPEGEKVHLEFEYFEIENGDALKQGRCTNDWLEVRNGDDVASSTLITRLCGKDKKDQYSPQYSGMYSPRRIRSSGSSLILIFKTNENPVTRRGFKVKIDNGKISLQSRFGKLPPNVFLTGKL